MAHLGVFDDDIVSRGATEQVSRNEAFSEDIVGYYVVASSTISPLESRYYPVLRLAVFDAGITNHGEDPISLFEEFDEEFSSFPVASTNISVMESLRPNVVTSGTVAYEIIQSLKVARTSSSESLASLAAAKTSAVEVIQYLVAGSESGLTGLFEDDMVDLTAEGEVNQRAVFDCDVPIWFVRGHNFEAASAVAGSSDLPVESLMTSTSPLSQTNDHAFESLQTVQPSSDLPYEIALGYVSADNTTICEALRGLAAPVAAAPSVLAYLGIFDSDFAYLGADDAILRKNALFEEDLVDPTASTSTLGFDAAEFDDVFSIDADELSVDDEMLFVALPLDTFGISFESLIGLTPTADIVHEALGYVKNSSNQSLTQVAYNALFGLFDDDTVDLTADADVGVNAFFDEDIPLTSVLVDSIQPVTGTAVSDHLWSPAGGSSQPHGGSGNLGLHSRRRRRQ